jgi:hypothetical protein
VRYFLLLCFFSQFVGAHGQMISPSSPVFLARLNCYSKNFADAFSISANPAAVVQLSEFTAGVLTERKFLLGELNQYTIVGVTPTKLGGFGFQLNYFGYAGYRDLETSIIYGKKLGTVDLGIGFHYRMINVPGYGNYAKLFPAIGTIWHFSEKVHAGISAYHPLSVFDRDNLSERLAYSYSTGLGYEVSNLVFVGFAIRKEEERRAEFCSGIQYQFAKQFFAQMGISTPGTQARMGAGWRWQSLRVDVTASWHMRLGVSPGFSVIYQPPKETK